MGSSYSSLTLRGADRGRTIAALQAAGRDAFVGPDRDGAFVVFDAASEHEPRLAEALAVDLSRELGGVALAVTVHDDDVLHLSLVRGGTVVDRYDSQPGYLNGEEAPPVGGDAALLTEALGAPAARDEVERILRTPGGEGDYLFETARHQDLVDALDLPDYAVGIGYEYVCQGDAEEMELELATTGAAAEALAAGGEIEPDFDDPITDPRAAAHMEAMRAQQRHPAHGYFRALVDGDVPAMRALFAGVPSLDEPVGGPAEGDEALAAHVDAVRAHFDGRTVHYAPASVVETPERTVSTGQLALAAPGSVTMLPVATVWDRDAGGVFTAARIYYSLGVLTGRRGERAPVLPEADGLPLPEAVEAHLAALAADDVAALVSTYDASCLSPLPVPFFDPEDTVRGHYGAMLGQDGGCVLRPCTVTSTDDACALEYVATRWDGSEVPPQAGLAVLQMRDRKVCQVQLYADLGPEPDESGMGALGLPGLGGAMPDLSGLASAFGGGMPGIPGGPGAAGLAGMDMEQMQQMMEGVQQMLNDTLSRPGGAASLFKSLGQLGGLGGLGGLGAGGLGALGAGGLGGLFGNLPGMDDEDDDELRWDFEQDEEDVADEEEKHDDGGKA